VHERVIGSLAAAVDQYENMSSFEQLYGQLKERSLTLLYSVVHVTTVEAAKWWVDCFEELYRGFPPLDVSRAQLVFALSISYSDGKRTALSVRRRRGPITRYFASRYPEHFLEWNVAPRPPPPPLGFSVSRLIPAEADHVRDWCEDGDVAPSIRNIRRASFLKQFQKKTELPMDEVIENLGEIMRTHTKTPPQGGLSG
jgi:hypothetical protein